MEEKDVSGKLICTKTKVQRPLFKLLEDETYSDLPESEGSVYIKNQNITLQPGFESNPNQDLDIGPNVFTPDYAVARDEIISVNYYDEYGRVIQTQVLNHMDKKEITNTLYDFTGKVTKTNYYAIMPFCNNEKFVSQKPIGMTMSMMIFIV